MVQGSARLFPDADEILPIPSAQPPDPRSVGGLQQDLQDMCDILQPDDSIKLAIQLESSRRNRKRYFLIVSKDRNDNSIESIVLGVDITSSNSERSCTIGLVFPIWRDTHVYLDGDGGFSVTSGNRTCIFKPLNIQAMWTVLQALHTCCQEALSHNLFPSGGTLSWANYYNDWIRSSQNCINEWHAMSDLISVRPPSPTSNGSLTTMEIMENEIRAQLRTVMVNLDFDKVTAKQIRELTEQRMGRDLKEFRSFLDNEMILIVAQMDSPSQIFDYLYLGSEWNASNLPELEENGVGYILNVTREIDNFYPGRFHYMNVRVFDEEETDLLSHWEHTYRFISTARAQGSRCLVHCKMGMSRSGSTVIAFAMKEYGWDLERALGYVRERRKVVKPNAGFLSQLHTYQGIIRASQQRHNTLWRRRPDANLEDQPPSQDSLEPVCTIRSPPRPVTLSPRPRCPSAPSPRAPDPPSGLSPLLESPSSPSTGPGSPSDTSPQPESPSASSPEPGSPSSPSPSSLPPRPPSPSPRPPSPSSLPPRPPSPSPRPPSPSSLPPRPPSPPPRPPSPSSLPPRPPSPSPSPRPPSPSSPSPRPDSPQGPPRPPSPSSLPARPDSPRGPSPQPPSPSTPSGKPSPPSHLVASAPPSGGRRVPPPLLRGGSLIQQRVDLLALMRQVEAMESLEEAQGTTEGKEEGGARGWRRRRAFSLQGLDLRTPRTAHGEVEVPDVCRRPRRSLRHSDALDLAEEQEGERGKGEECPGTREEEGEGGESG